MKSTISQAEWVSKGRKLFGDDQMQWRFVCPSCGHVASVQDWRDAGAPEGAVGFSCIGRYIGDPDAGKRTFRQSGGPCDYAGGGLIGLNPITVLIDGSGERSVFDFASLVDKTHA